MSSINPLQAAAEMERAFRGNYSQSLLELTELLYLTDPENLEKAQNAAEFLRKCSNPKKALGYLEPEPTLAKVASRNTPVPSLCTPVVKPRRSDTNTARICSFGAKCNKESCKYRHLKKSIQEGHYTFMAGKYTYRLYNEGSMTLLFDEEDNVCVLCIHCVGNRCHGGKKETKLFVQHHPGFCEMWFWTQEQGTPVSAITLPLFHPNGDFLQALAKAKFVPRDQMIPGSDDRKIIWSAVADAADTEDTSDTDSS